LTVTAHNLEGYDAPAIEWERVRELTSTDVTHAPDTGGPNRHTSWLTTIGEDGMPHVRPIGVVQRRRIGFRCKGLQPWGWPCSVDGEALTAEFSASSGGTPPYFLYREPSRVYAFGTAEPY
jgi:hypothetical protein